MDCTTRIRPLMTPSEAALYLNISRSNLAVMRARGTGPAYVKLGETKTSPVRYRQDDLDAWLDSMRQVPDEGGDGLMNRYICLHQGMVLSSVWNEPDNVRILWVTLLCLADEDGFVDCSLPALAARCRKTIDETKEALQALAQPDVYSRLKNDEGARIIPVDRGWYIVNYEQHQERGRQASMGRKR